MGSSTDFENFTTSFSQAKCFFSSGKILYGERVIQLFWFYIASPILKFLHVEKAKPNQLQICQVNLVINFWCVNNGKKEIMALKLFWHTCRQSSSDLNDRSFSSLHENINVCPFISAYTWLGFVKYMKNIDKYTKRIVIFNVNTSRFCTSTL